MGHSLKSGAALLTPKNFSPAQQAAITAAFENDAQLLIGDTGFGKTAVTLTAAAELIAAEHLARVLVIAPAKVVGNWPAEVGKWTQLQGLRVRAGTGEVDVKAMVASDAQVIVTSYESVKFIVATDHGCDGVVYDEITRAKEPGSIVVRKMRQQTFKWRLGLSATPLSENWLALYSMCLLLDGGVRFGTRYEKWQNKYFYPTDYQRRNWVPHSWAVDEMVALAADLVHLVDVDDKASGLPPIKVYRDDTLVLPENLRELQHEMIKRGVGLVGARKITPANRAVLQGKLRQLAQGFVMHNDGEAQWLWDGRVRYVTDLVYELRKRGEAVVVAFEYTAAGRAMARMMGEVDLIDGSTSKGAVNEIMARWRAGQGQVLLLQQRAGSHGIDGLQASARHLILFAPLWSRDATLQLRGRIWRTGQTRPVVVDEVCVGESIDATVYGRVEDKGDVFNEFIEGILALETAAE